MCIRDRKGEAAKNALKGAGIGFLVGVGIALLDGPPEENCFLCLSQGEKILLYGLGLATEAAYLSALFTLKIKIPINPAKQEKRKRKALFRDL